MHNDEFMRAGLCAQTDPEAFHPDKGTPSTPAQAVCRRCPVEADCLEYALATDQRFGVWGGTTARERHAMRQHQQRPTRAQQDRDDKRDTARRMAAAGRSKNDIANALRLNGSRLNDYLNTDHPTTSTPHRKGRDR